MQVAGIDGCRAGWLALTIVDDQWGYLLERSLYSLLSQLSADLIFIDIPIGLSSVDFNRNVDVQARAELSPARASSIFTPPCREAIEAQTYRQALDVNRKVTGKGISIQSWNISKKIREADQLLRKQSQLKNQVFESHPEICFKFLNGGSVVRSSKKTAEGADERFRILTGHDSGLVQFIEHIHDNTLRKEVAKDDILDSAALALSARYARRNELQLVGGHEAIDACGIPVRIVYGRSLHGI